MMTYDVKLELASGQFLGGRKNTGTGFEPSIFIQNSGEVDIQTLNLTDDQSKIFENIISTLNRIPEGSTDIDFDTTVDVDAGRKLGARSTDANGNIKEIYLVNSGGTEIASLPLTSTELRQFKFSLAEMNRVIQDSL